MWKSSRLAYLDGLRGIAALNVLVVHAVVVFDFGMITGHPESSHLIIDKFVPSLPLMFQIMADLPVCVFFILSGIVLSGSFERSFASPLANIVKRYLRLMPTILVSSLLAYTLFMIFGDVHREAVAVTKSTGAALNLPNGLPGLWTVFQEATYTALLGNFSYQSTINSVLWTMGPEFQGSVLVILIAWIGSLLGKGSRRCDRTITFLHLATLIVFAGAYISLFSAGALLAKLLRSSKLNGPSFSGWMIFAGSIIGTIPNSIVSAWILPGVPSLPFYTVPHSPGSFYHGIGALMLVAGVMKNDRVKRALTNGAPQFLGKISFALYLIHMPILLTLGSFLVMGASYVGLNYPAAVSFAFTCCLLFVVLASMAITKFIDDRAITLSANAARLIDAAHTSIRLSNTRGA